MPAAMCLIPIACCPALGCEVDQAGFITVPPAGQHLRYLGAGNVVDPRAQIITAVGAESAAAIAISADLV
jgi:hypothetical protein